MADETITIPDFKFTGMYYPQILRTLRQWRRIYASEITSEDDHEPFEQLLRAYALASHISNVLADMVALETFLPTSKLLSSVRNHLQLIDYYLKQATPADVDALIELSKVFTTATLVVGPPSQHMTQFATEQTETDDEIVFEYLDLDEEGLTIARTDKLGSCLAEERVYPEEPDTASFTDYTDEANDIGANTFSPWTLPAQNDALYFGHADVMFDRVDIVITTGSFAIQGVWEYYNKNYESTNPEEVTNNGSSLTFKCNPLLTAFDHSGSLVRVTYLPTGAYAEGYSTFDEPDNLVTIDGILGQITTPSTNVDDYSIGVLWAPLPDVLDETVNLQETGKVTFSLPQTEDYEWTPGTVDTFTGFMVRYRIVSVTTPISPIIDGVEIHRGKQYIMLPLVQGKTVSDEPLGSSNGLANQEFRLKQSPILDDTLIIEVSNVIWSQVDNFLLSGPQEKHYILKYDDDGTAIVKFGDGINGGIPVMGVNNIAAYYRIGGDADGNIPANSLTANTSGLAYVASVTNPRPGNGWKIADGGSEEELARIKIAGPASLRAMGRAINPGDLEALPPNYQDANGSSPITRLYAIEEAYGPKTMEAVVVGQGGNYLTSDQIDEFSVYLNGDPTTSPPVRGHGPANTEITVVNYVRRLIDVTVTVYGGDRTTVANALAALLSPLKLASDGVTYLWNFGGEVPMSSITAAITATSAAIWKVTLVEPAQDIVLLRRELPWPGDILVTIVS